MTDTNAPRGRETPQKCGVSGMQIKWEETGEVQD